MPAQLAWIARSASGPVAFGGYFYGEFLAQGRAYR